MYYNHINTHGLRLKYELHVIEPTNNVAECLPGTFVIIQRIQCGKVCSVSMADDSAILHTKYDSESEH
jgi:hypothetical protein